MERHPTREAALRAHFVYIICVIAETAVQMENDRKKVHTEIQRERESVYVCVESERGRDDDDDDDDDMIRRRKIRMTYRVCKI